MLNNIDIKLEFSRSSDDFCLFGITYGNYKVGNTLYAFDLTPDLCSADHFNLLKDGSLD